MLFDAPKSGALRERVLNLGLETLCIVIRGWPLGRASPRRPEFLHGSVVSYQPEGKTGAVLMSEETFPNNLGHLEVHMGPASRVPHGVVEIV